MIPLHLRISGFLSYHDPVELDFTKFDLACISGHNGAGKSSLLDSITWSLFGEARGKSSDVINIRQDVKAAEVMLTFQHEDNTYRIQRTLPRNKSTILEFQVRTQFQFQFQILFSKDVSSSSTTTTTTTTSPSLPNKSATFIFSSLKWVIWGSFHCPCHNTSHFCSCMLSRAPLQQAL